MGGGLFGEHEEPSILGGVVIRKKRRRAGVDTAGDGGKVVCVCVCA